LTRHNSTNDRNFVDQWLQAYEQVTLQEHPIDAEFDAMPWLQQRLITDLLEAHLQLKVP
jgi:hypothetical protein